MKMIQKNGYNFYIKEILVKFKDRDELTEYTTNILNLLVTDKEVEYICLADTGELIYTCENGMMI